MIMKTRDILMSLHVEWTYEGSGRFRVFFFFLRPVWCVEFRVFALLLTESCSWNFNQRERERERERESPHGIPRLTGNHNTCRSTQTLRLHTHACTQTLTHTHTHTHTHVHTHACTQTLTHTHTHTHTHVHTHTCTHTHTHTVQTKSLDTPSHSMSFLSFHDYWHCRFTLKVSKLWINTCGIMNLTKKCKTTENTPYILVSSK